MTCSPNLGVSVAASCRMGLSVFSRGDTGRSSLGPSVTTACQNHLPTTWMAKGNRFGVPPVFVPTKQTKRRQRSPMWIFPWEAKDLHWFFEHRGGATAFEDFGAVHGG